MTMLREINKAVDGRLDSTDPRVGVLASEIPAGTLPAFLANDIDPAFPNRLYRFEILTLPERGTLFLDKRGAGYFAGAPDGTYSGTQVVEKFDPGSGIVSRAEGSYSLNIASSLPVVTGVAIVPKISVLAGGSKQQYGATVLGTNNPSQSVTWATTAGTVTAAGELTAPVAGALPTIGYLTATSVADPTQSATATFTVPAEVVVTPPVLQPAVRYARPVRDLAKGSWAPSAGSDLFAVVDGLDNPDYMRANLASTCEIALGPVVNPGTRKNQVIRYNAHAPGGGSLTVELHQGNNLIATWYHAALPVVPTLHEQILTGEQCDRIADYGSLRVKLVAA